MRCGSSRSWASSAGDLDAAEPAFVRETVIVSPSGRRVHLPLPTNGAHAAVVARRALDAALVEVARGRGVDIREGLHGRGGEAGRRRRCSSTFDDGSVLDASFVDRGRRPLVDGPTHALEPDAPRDLGEWHAVAAVLRQCRRRTALGDLRTRPPARIRVGVPATRRTGERRLRRAAFRRSHRSRAQGPVARPVGPAGHARHPRPEGPTVGVGARVADPDALRTRTSRQRARALRRATRRVSSIP